MYTNNNPVTHIITKDKLSATGQRWVNELAELNFSIHYRPGKQNVRVDTLSRLSSKNHLECMEAFTKLTQADQVKVILDGIKIEIQMQQYWYLVCLP